MNLADMMQQNISASVTPSKCKWLKPHPLLISFVRVYTGAPGGVWHYTHVYTHKSPGCLKGLPVWSVNNGTLSCVYIVNFAIFRMINWNLKEIICLIVSKNVFLPNKRNWTDLTSRYWNVAEAAHIKIDINNFDFHNNDILNYILK